MSRALAALLLGLLLAAGTEATASRVAKNSPVTKVVTLLKDMMAQLEREGEEDEKVYESMGCWCETGEKEKTKAIADAKATIDADTATSEKSAALSSQMNTEIADTKDELAASQEALDTATSLRQKQLAEFSAEEKDMIGSIGSLKSAVAALSKHHSSADAASFLQVSEAKNALRSTLQRHGHILEPRQRLSVTSFIQEKTSLRQPASGQIFGIMKQMKETFETNLAASQKEESTNQQSYSELKVAKEAEIAAATAQIESKTTIMAEADEKKASADQDKVDTEANLAADTQYLADLKEKCKNVDAEFEERTKARQLEIQATSKALGILTSDEAQDLVAKTLGLAQEDSFLQVESRNTAQQRQRVSKMLSKAARHDPRLSLIAAQVRADAFGKVKESIQEMVDKLLKEKEDDFKKKDNCVDMINTNLKAKEDTDRKKNDAAAKADEHQSVIDTLKKEIKTLKASVDETLVEIKRMSEEREKANKEYQITVADQRATQKLLSAALSVLKGVFEGASLLQVRGGDLAPAGAPPPPSFKKYEKNAASGGVMGMIQAIIDDAKAMEADAIKAEEDALTNYEGFVADTAKDVEAMRKDITAKTELKAKEEQDKVMEESNRDAAQEAYDELMQEELDLHRDCDYLLKNFEVRIEARDAEVGALKEAIATFSGATFSALVQSPW